MTAVNGEGFRRVAVVMAMHDEAEPIIEALGARPVEHHGSHLHDWFETTLTSHEGGSIEVLVAVNAPDPHHGVAGVGPEPAVMTTLHVVEHWRPDLVISAGTAGGWASKGGAIGRAYIAHPVAVRHDRRIDIPDYDRFGIGSFPTEPLTTIVDGLGLVPGVVTSGGSLDETEADRQMIKSSGAVAKDMEAAAVAHVCALHATPFTAIKVLTDLHDVPVDTAEQFVANLTAASAELGRLLLALLDRLALARLRTEP